MALEKVLLPTMRTLAEKAGFAANEVEEAAGKMLATAAGNVTQNIEKLIASDARNAAVKDELHAVLGNDFLKDGLPFTKRTPMGFMDFEPPKGFTPAPPTGMSAEELFPSVFKAINESGADATRKDIMTRAARDMLGYENSMSPFERATAELADKYLLPFETVTKLGLSAVSQGSQVLTGVVRTQYKDAFKNTIASFKDPDAQMFALESGAILSNVVRDAAATLFGGGSAGAQKFLNLVGFTKMDMNARVFGAMQGAAFAEHQSDKLYKLFQAFSKSGEKSPEIAKIEQKLLSIGIDPRDIIAQGGRLTTDQKLLAANSVAFDVNFWGDSLSLPAFFKTPHGRVITQFKSFAYQQTRFIRKHVIEPWVKYGDAGPALRFALLIPLGGEAIADIKSILRNKPRTDDLALRMLENIAQAGGFGLVADAYLQATRGMSSLASFAVGPAYTDVLSGLNAIGEASQGNLKKGAEQAVRSAPGVAAAAGQPGLAAALGATTPAIAETLFPDEGANGRSGRGGSAGRR